MCAMIPLHARTQYRALWFNGTRVGREYMADIMKIVFTDKTSGQDTLDITFANKNGKYFEQKAFKRGMRVKFVGGVTGQDIRTLFIGAVSTISITGSSSGSSITLHCTLTNPASPKYHEPSKTVYRAVTPLDAIDALCREVGLPVHVEAKSDIVNFSHGVIADWFPFGYNTALQRVWVIANTILGATAVVKTIAGEPTVVLLDKPQTSSMARKSAIGEIKWGENILSYTFKEKLADKQPKKGHEVDLATLKQINIDPNSVWLGHLDKRDKDKEFGEGAYKPTPESYAEEFVRKLGVEIPPEIREDVEQFTEEYRKLYADAHYSSINEAIAEARLRAKAAATGENEITADITVTTDRLFRAGNWIQVSGVGPYNGKYYIKTNTLTFGSSGVTQSLQLSSKQGNTGGKDLGDLPSIDNDQNSEWTKRHDKADMDAGFGK